MADRALGNPLGNPLGLAKAAGFQPESTTYTRIVSGSGVLIPPKGAKLMRVAVIGGGGGAWLLNGGSSCAGSGGGCSASRIVPAVSIKYVIGLGGLASATQAQTIGGATTAEFGAYSLLAQGGQGTSSGVGPGGAGFGGDYNYQGGYAYRADAGYSAGGGGAAGPCGSGGSGSQTNGTGYPGQLLSGWGCGGGGGGAAYSSANTTLNRGGGGGGAGGAGATVFASSGDIRQPYQAGPIFGLAANSPTAFNYPSAGGEVGGGGGVTVSGSSPYTAYGGNGGSGGLVVEWFY